VITAAELGDLVLLESLTDSQLDELLAVGEEVVFTPGLDLWHEGEHADDWWVLIEGRIDLVRHVGREDVVFARLDAPGRWGGGFRAWDEGGVYLTTGRTASNGRIMRVPAASLRALAVSWFPFGVHIIDGVFSTVRNIEEGARQRGALVTLGTLAAGLAHELNNPAAASARAVDGLEAANQGVLSALRELALAGVSAQQFNELDAVRLEITRPDGAVDALAVADLEDEIVGWLEDRGVERAWEFAPALAAAGVGTAWCQRVLDAVGDAALESAISWVASTLNVSALLTQVKESTRRISELVAAVKSYSQMDRASMQRVDVTEGLESTLVMLGHRLREGGVTVVRDYGADVPEVEAFPGELNQVWTNLVDNAVDAMEGEGTLRVSTRTSPDGVVVEIADTGRGMSPGTAERAFEAFFTTKGVGKGTGLGLDIARRIVVQRHRGTIEIDSEPGNTVMRVTLPTTSVES
jgi:signal transduction histidine kinase